MEKPTELLLQQLADRLGTTTEYLWAALVRQAPISAMAQLVILGALIGYTAWSVWYFRNHGRMKGDDGVERPRLSAFWFVGLGFMTGCFALVSLADLPLIISGLINPEYWALKQILP